MRRLVLAAVLSACVSDLSQVKQPGTGITSTTIEPVAFEAVYVVNGESATVSVIDARNNTVASTIALSGVAYPRRVTISPDRSLLGIAAPGYDLSSGVTGHEQHSSRPGMVLLLDARTGALKASKQTDAANNNVVFSPDGQVWTSQATVPGSTLVLDINNTSLDIRDAISVGTSPVDTVMSGDGALAFVVNSGSASLSVIDVATRALRGSVPVGAGPCAAQPGTDGLVFVPNETDETISVVDAAKLVVVRTFSLGFQPGEVALAGDQLWIPAPTRGGVEIRALQGDVVRFVTTGAGAYTVAFSGDGTRAYVSNQDDNSVSVIDRQSFATTARIPVGAKPNGLAWRAP